MILCINGSVDVFYIFDGESTEKPSKKKNVDITTVSTVTQALSAVLQERGLKFSFLDSDDSWVAETDFTSNEAPPKSPTNRIFVKVFRGMLLLYVVSCVCLCCLCFQCCSVCVVLFCFCGVCRVVSFLWRSYGDPTDMRVD